MSQAIQVMLNDVEKAYLFDVARQAIEVGLDNGSVSDIPELPTPPTELVARPLGGVFVTLNANSMLRGCIGMMQATGPMNQMVWRMAQAAAFGDSRFPPVTRQEWPDISLEITILGPLTVCPDRRLIELGRHGLLLRLGQYSAVFLPQVPVEQGWSLEQTLDQLCRKAGLRPGLWSDPQATLFWFEGLVLHADA